MNDDHSDSLEKMEKQLMLSMELNRQNASRSYMSAQRTLYVWLQTALTAMIFGIAIDRLGLLLYKIPNPIGGRFSHPDIPFSIIGTALVVFSMFMALSAGIRFLRFTHLYKKEFPLPEDHKVWHPEVYAFMVMFFSALLLTLMLWIR